MSDRGNIPPAERERLRRAVAAEKSTRSELLAAVAAANRAGGSVRVIAAETGRSKTTIQKWLSETT